MINEIRCQLVQM